MFRAIMAALLVALISLLAYLSPASASERWKLCRHPGANFTCGTASCLHILATFPRLEECVAAKNSRNFPLAEPRTMRTAKPAGAAGLAECRKRYGKSVTSAEIAKDGKTLNCYSTSDDPKIMRDACKKRWGPMSQIRRHRGKWYCTA